MDLLNSVEFAPILTNGNLGQWSPSSTVFPYPRNNFSSFVYQDFLFLSGGSENGAPCFDDVLYARLAQDGGINTFSSVSTFPIPRDFHHSFIYQNHFYILGGTSENATLSHNTILFAPWIK